MARLISLSVMMSSMRCPCLAMMLLTPWLSGALMVTQTWGRAYWLSAMSTSSLVYSLLMLTKMMHPKVEKVLVNAEWSMQITLKMGSSWGMPVMRVLAKSLKVVPAPLLYQPLSQTTRSS